MKKSLTFLTVLFLSTCAVTQPYFFSQSSATYQSLDDSISINNGSVWSSFQSFTVPIGFNFDFMGNSYSTIYIEGSGFARFDPSYYYLINPFTVQLEDKGSGTSLSPLFYRLDGAAPNRVLKIEWKNCGFVNDAAGTANFQLWLYETSNIIDVRIGTCVAAPSAYAGNGSTGPAIGIYEFSSVTYCIYGIGLQGNSSAVNDSTIQNSTADIFEFALDNTPVSGTVYRFTPGVLNIPATADMTWTISQHDRKLQINRSENSSGPCDLIIMDSAGRIVLFQKINSETIVDLDFLSRGIHYCVISEDGKICVQKKFVMPVQ